MNTQKYETLQMCCLNAEQHARTCDYWYTVTNGATAHTAFNTANGLRRWLAERGLSLKETLPEKQGEWKSIEIQGSYSTTSHMSYDEFWAVPNIILDTRTLSNGSYTLARIEEDENGHRTVHTLNCNCKHRAVYDYQESRQIYN